MQLFTFFANKLIVTCNSFVCNMIDYCVARSLMPLLLSVKNLIHALLHYFPLVASGAHELPKAVKEHATECHHNPNYITFELNWLLSCVYCFK